MLCHVMQVLVTALYRRPFYRKGSNLSCFILLMLIYVRKQACALASCFFPLDHIGIFAANHVCFLCACGQPSTTDNIEQLELIVPAHARSSEMAVVS
jgi:hypothetical protein